MLYRETAGHMTALLDLGDKKPPHKFELNALSNDDWAKTSGMWLLKLSKTKDFKVKLDGKPAAGG